MYNQKISFRGLRECGESGLWATTVISGLQCLAGVLRVAGAGLFGRGPGGQRRGLLLPVVVVDRGCTIVVCWGGGAERTPGVWSSFSTPFGLGRATLCACI